MKYISGFLLLMLSFTSMVAQNNKGVDRPKLVVGVVLDQMRSDYLYRFYNRLSVKGFKRLMHDGNVCENTFINYLPSYTGPGHACIYTGTVPSLHGISSNDWIDRESGANVYCTADIEANHTGGTVKAGKMSPKNLWSSTITDELRLATNFKSKVIAVSVKDRGAILPGGHTANASYWMDDSNAVFMSSDFYMKELPSWVKEFNDRKLAKTYLQNNWNTLYPINTYTESTTDDNLYEGKFIGETATKFPHVTANLPVNDIKKTPYGNDIVLDFTKEAIVREKLGQGTATDFLAVSFSSTDYIGHAYGPNSVEIEDCYLRMDKTIEQLIDFLDAEVGDDQYTLFLTADHGVAHVPLFLKDHKIPAGLYFTSTLKTELNGLLAQKFSKQNIVKDISENFIWINDSVVNAYNLNKFQISQEIIRHIRFKKEIHYAVDMHEMVGSNLPNKIKEMAINGFVEKRSGDILLLLNPGWLDAYSKTGTTHGTWNPYDTHIPLIWYGWGIQKGITRKEVYMTDIAATLATLLHIQMPNACIGKTIEEVLK
ncbi:MAG: alkaline phosphatase family protein [Bacteroidetes bacterium]|nr:alkaline phosphatase family protein [Bacteroidota bacterium]